MSQTYVDNYSSTTTTTTTTVKKSNSPPLAASSSRHSQAEPSSVTKSDLKPEPDLPLDFCLSPSTTRPMSVKQESPSVSRSQSPSTTDVKPVKKEEEGYGSPMLDDMNASASGSSSKRPSPPAGASSSSRKAVASAPQLIGHLPVAREEALASFTEMPDNWYQYKSLGRSRELLESMTCDCVFDPDSDDPEVACGHSSDCINRLTQVECLPGDCRFQNKQYAAIEIVKTEMKGYGLRIESDIPKDTFIYEYVGDVVNNQSFKKRMRDYANEGIQHFYFMMLQKDEFIDATKNGGIGRFANHSCNPNCYVAKWTIGNTVRMGIFSKRNIKKHEELTFNYNVDRYGHQAQTCYCGEPNCVGFIGGKTQTDVSTMDDLYLDALGITDDADVMVLKGTKKKKGKKIDDPDFMPQMKPIVEKEVPKVVQALRQVQSKKVLSKLLTRIKITEDGAALRQIMRLRGFSIMKNILEDYAEELDLVALALQSMVPWPLVVRNKVEDSQIMIPVEKFTESTDEAVKACAIKLKEHWQTLDVAYRIPKRTAPSPPPSPPRISFDPPAEAKRSRFIDADDQRNRIIMAARLKKRHNHSSGSFPRKRTPEPERSPTPQTPKGPSIWELNLEKQKQTNAAINSIIAAAAEERAAAEAAAEERARIAAEEAAADAEKQKKDKDKDKDRHGDRKKSSQSSAEREANKEKRLHKLVGAIVVKCMSKHKSSMETDVFKKYAKELTEKIAEREKKSSAYREGKLDSLSEEKTAKIKKYANEYITSKILRKVGKSSHRSRPSITPGAPSNSDGTPNSADLPSTMADLGVDEDMETDSDGENGVPMDLGDDEDNAWNGSGSHEPPDAHPPMEVDIPKTRNDKVSDPRQRPP
ncbi:histone methyltransferase set2 [Paramarasmius palmivorus]|uniref:Histone-lysine N-methyltransferase, H3 lysine-36 specific n=1 Tax=Paramarasmius palmivorus TaxID=297713 RepID=A0AAW0D4B4_9AGAR